ncbi:MAG: rhodanese-like domain-containing protein [Thermodesulforhabdaceae bacterium]
MTGSKAGTAIETMFIDELEDYRANRKEKDYELIDVREPEEYLAGHIPGARLMPLSRFEELLGSLESDKDLLLYCGSGKRSMIAALMIAESDLKPARTINLQGGYSAWDGKELTGFPKINLFADKTSLHEILQEAINLEKGAFRFYTLSAAQESAWADTAKKLINWERHHAQTVYHILESLSPKKPLLPPFEELFETLPGNILEGGEPLEEAINKLKALPISSCYAFAELALDIEYHAYDLYKNASTLAKDARTSEILKELADQEKSHILFIAKVFASCRT